MRCTLNTLRGYALPLLMGLAVMSSVPFVSAQEKKAAPPANVYPRVTLSKWYAVDPKWPQRPQGVNWGAVPGIAVDDKDNVYVVTRAKPPVQVYDSSGKYLRGWGDDLFGTNGSHHIEIDKQGNIWLADITNHVIMQCTPEGKLLKKLGTPGEAGVDDTHFNKPTDMAITPDGEVFISDGYGNNRVVHYDRNGKFVKAWGKLGTGPGEFSIPHAIALDSQGRIYVADRNNARVQVFNKNGQFVEEWKNIVLPWGFWVTAQDEIWVTGSSPMQWRETDTNAGIPPKDQVFMKFATSGKLLELWTVPKGEDKKEVPGDLNWVHCLAVDSQGNIYAGDIQGQRAQKFVRQK